MGSLLGDAHLVATTRGFAFRINHGIAQKKYVDWKYLELKNLTNSSPRVCNEKVYYFRSASHPFFNFLRSEFYRGRVKILPNNLDRWITPLSLAIWFMDDGAKDGRQVRINTQSFSLRENKRLINILEAKLGIFATINRDKNKFRLRVKNKSMSRFRKLILPYLLPGMRYKLSP
ncbi:MAG: hypothetical protein A3I97_02610 [Candidatus Taylorbacteria bacterium RIFCSPLOWO2_02_FULL_44_35]|nr:MAG: hypothetical protein A3I97_02610 [Candidatus Taylorbacteria bacterium RIFCSPLOWO2_02_FULL_44_35]